MLFALFARDAFSFCRFLRSALFFRSMHCLCFGESSGFFRPSHFGCLLSLALFACCAFSFCSVLRAAFVLCLPRSLRFSQSPSLGRLAPLALFARDVFGFCRFPRAAVLFRLPSRLSCSFFPRLFGLSRLHCKLPLALLVRGSLNLRHLLCLPLLFGLPRHFHLG
jgi:hypothetical protein